MVNCATAAFLRTGPRFLFQPIPPALPMTAEKVKIVLWK
ncbi:MAG: hypothetical protein AVDCRST_MAG83-31 [uncultured Arthrobacter sp.]|uniref:Uncharacterized protein n=1 Tax=uncultured Arthrobacter sp. TaxID=114050 RepID=A0A6J4H255_9MICC|nr:MAG: hypothetical protein AVDCRST_MAG83-31 [uncultured Arthrobacter sp.]